MKHVGGGWVRLSSTIVDSPVFREHGDMFRLWILLLCSAHRHEMPLRLASGLELQRGELVTSLGGLKAKLERAGNPQEREPARIGPSRQAITRYLDKMEKDGMIVRVSAPYKGTVVRVVNFAEYQDILTYSIGRADSSDGRAYTRADKSGQAQDGETTQDSDPSQVVERTGERTRAAIDESVYPNKQTGEHAPAPDLLDAATHPPAHGKETPQASRPWIVQSEWATAYDAAYGHPPYWDARRHDEGARAIISYLDGLCRKRRMELTDETVRQGAQRAAGKYLADKSAWLTKAQHPFSELVKNIHVYLHAKE